jgi:AcrR family transcriptional regulator
MSKGEETRAVILDEALGLASRVGFDGLTIGGLAEQTGMSKSGLFAHFRSKEQLQLQTLAHARRRFIDTTVRPTLSAPRGEPRVRELFDRWLAWATQALPGGCIFAAGSIEFDDQPGPMRDALVADERDWLDTIATVAETAISEGHFHPATDPRQIAFEVHGVMLGYHHAARLLRDPDAATRAHRAFEGILDRARTP